MPLRINVWSSPRNISTAFMYSFAQRTDTTVVDEPLYAHYLSKTDTPAVHPGSAEVLSTQSSNGNEVVEHIILGEAPTPVVLFKQMTHHLIQMDWSFMRQTKNILLIRDPRAIIYSYAQVIPNPSIQDIGVAMQSELFEYLKNNRSLDAVVDATQLVLNPKSILEQLCLALGLEFQEAMLSWVAGPKPYDGVWAPYWYEQVHQSTGFQPYQPRTYELAPQLEPLAAACQVHYEQLFEHALKAG